MIVHYDSYQPKEEYKFAVQEANGNISLFISERAARLFSEIYAPSKPCLSISIEKLQTTPTRYYAYGDAVLLDDPDRRYSRLRLALQPE
jgi:hypothetical protein